MNLNHQQDDTHSLVSTLKRLIWFLLVLFFLAAATVLSGCGAEYPLTIGVSTDYGTYQRNPDGTRSLIIDATSNK